MKTRTKRWLWALAGVGGLLAVALLVGFGMLRQRLPPGVMQDIRAGLPVRDIKDPNDRLAKYLENRYGPLTDPANRQQVFLDFFNVERIKTLQFLVRHSPADHRQPDIEAMASWLAAYRANLTPEEKSTLKGRFEGAEGQTMLRRATAQYNSQDVWYRGNTAPVISQLLQTVKEVQQAR